MLERARGLSPHALRALAELERQVVEADGGRLKLEWGTLEARSGSQVEDLLWWQGEQLLGFLGLYAFGASCLELVGMVAPAARRRGIATALLDAALPLCRQRNYPRALLVVPGASVAGSRLAQHRGATLDHSEHALVLLDRPSSGPEDPQIGLRRAVPADAAVVTALLEAAFGHPAPGLYEQLASENERTLLVEAAGTPVGTIRLTRRGDAAGVYGFAVDPDWQGRGIGRDVLRRVCHQLRGEGARRIGLEVAVDNESALGLYTSVGFTIVTTEDYYALTLGALE